MKEKLQNKYLAWGLTIFCVFAALICLFFCIYRWDLIFGFITKVVDILMPFIFGLVIAYLMNPLVRFFELKVYSKLWDKIFKNKKGNKRKTIRVLSIFTSTLIFLGLLITCISYLIPEMISSLEMFIANIDLYLNNSKDLLVKIFGGSNTIEEFINNNYDSFEEFFVKWLNDGMLNDIMESLSQGIFGTLKFIYNLVVGYIISIYVLFDKDKFKAQSRKIMYSMFDEDTIDIISDNAKYTDKIFGDFFAGKLIDSLIIGILCFIGMIIFDIPYALVIAVLVGVTNIIPYFGPFIGAIPSVLLILLVDPSKCVTFIIFIFILQQFDGNVLGPKILGNKTGLSSFWVLFSLLIFGGLFGVVGMIIGVPLFSILYTCINSIIKKKLKKKNLPLDSKDYENLDRKSKKKATV